MIKAEQIIIILRICSFKDFPKLFPFFVPLIFNIIFDSLFQADLEEAKTQENAKLQSALQDVQLQFKEAKDLLLKEREAAKKLAEQVPVIQEVPVVDHGLMDKLTAENEKLKVRSLKMYCMIYWIQLC